MRVFVHAAAGGVALLLVSLFWSATALSELFGDAAAIASVKAWILWGMAVLVPAMMVVAGSGFALSKRWKSPVVARKKRRMRLIAANGLLILLPSAWFLAGLAAQGRYDGVFMAVQGVELLAGAINISLLWLNMRDGLRLRAKPRKSAQMSVSP